MNKQVAFERGFRHRKQELLQKIAIDQEVAFMIPAALSMGSLGVMTHMQNKADKEMRRHLKNLPSVDENEMKKILKGMNVNIPLRKDNKLRNAVYVKKDAVTGKEGIVYSEKFSKAPVMFHEGGHARIERGDEGGYHKIMQNLRWLPLAGVLGGVAASNAMPLIAANLNVSPLTAGAGGAALGAGLYGLTHLPTLINERKASDVAKRFMLGKKKYNKEQDHKLLDSAYGTYKNKAVGSAIAGSLMLGGGAALHKIVQDG